jgi:RNA polymerase sigma factor (sigma-70 family)
LEESVIGAGQVTPVERDYLLRLCAYLTGSADAAEDLTQETLIEAWRHEHNLRDPNRRMAWLGGIARNVCKRWQRSRLAAVEQMDTLSHSDEPADTWDVEAELERAELARLLDRAMALLPNETRMVLVARFIEELPHGEIGQRLNLSEGTVKVRVHRGKIALKRLLTTQFATELDGYHVPAEGDAWQETRIWCMGCGSHRMLMRVATETDTVSFRCPGCDPLPQVSSNYPLSAPQFASVAPGVTRPSIILRRGQEWCREYFAGARAAGVLPCTRCGTPMRLEVIPPDESGLPKVLTDRIQAFCTSCGDGASVSRTGLVSVLPEVRELRQRETRVRLLPSRRLEAGGRPAVLTSIDSVAGSARIDVVTDVETYRVLTVQRGGLPAQF